MKAIEKKRINEKRIIKEMILLYYKDENNLECQELIEYSFNRIDNCPVIESKTFCSKCHINCYEDIMREDKNCYEIFGTTNLF